MAAINRRPLMKTAFKKAKAIGPLYTGGPVALTQDGRKLVTCMNEIAVMSDVESGMEICRFANDTSDISAFCLTPSDLHLLVFTASMSLRIFEVPLSFSPTPKPIQPIRVTPRAHDAPVHVCTADPSSTYLASGSADGVVKVWDIHRGFVTHVFKGHGGVVSALKFSMPTDTDGVIAREARVRLITASVDTKLRVFDLVAARESGRKGGSSKPEAVLEGHHSVPRGLDVSEDGRWLISGGRDSVALLWDLTGGGKSSKLPKGKENAVVPVLVKTIPVLERVEAIGLLLPDETIPGSSSSTDFPRFYVGGEKGVVRIWDTRSGSAMCSLGDQEKSAVSDDQEEQRQIVDAIYIPSAGSIVSIHADQNIVFHALISLSLSRQIIGYNDEIVDASFLSYTSQQRDSHIALATNSSLIRVYSTSTHDARLLPGHTDVVLALDHALGGEILASGSKDRSARVWAPVTSAANEWAWACVGLCEGHAESVGAVAMTHGEDLVNGERRLTFMFTGSQDRTIKMWDLSRVPTAAQQDSDPMKCKSLLTLKAHDKDINSLDVSPNNRQLASGSQDKTAKIYEIEYTSTKLGMRGELKLLGTCKGHKRGVWTVRFSNAERILATGSGDKTVRLWNLDDFSCVKTFEGHTNSVLRVDFLNSGMQMVSTASDGLVKLWNVRNEECVTTMDGHEDKVWALAVSHDERTVVSGAADSVINFWEDCTEEQELEKESKRADIVLKEQDLQNYLALQDYSKAISLALSMEQPGRLFKLLQDVRSNLMEDTPTSTLPSFTGHPAVDEVLRTLDSTELTKLLSYLRDWNTRAKTSAIAQDVLYAILKLRSAEDIMSAYKNTGFSAMVDDDMPVARKDGDLTALKDVVDAIIPYTERHLSRMDKLIQESYVIDYLLSEMDTVLGDMEEEGTMETIEPAGLMDIDEDDDDEDL